MLYNILFTPKMLATSRNGPTFAPSKATKVLPQKREGEIIKDNKKIVFRRI